MAFLSILQPWFAPRKRLRVTSKRISLAFNHFRMTKWRAMSRPISDVTSSGLCGHDLSISDLEISHSGSLLHEVNITVLLQEFEIADPVKIILRAHFHFRVLDDLGQIALPIAPVKRCGGWRPEAAGRKSFPLTLRNLIQRESAHSLAANDDLFGFGTEVGGNRLYRLPNAVPLHAPATALSIRAFCAAAKEASASSSCGRSAACFTALVSRARS